jgi:hypothetical protein
MRDGQLHRCYSQEEDGVNQGDDGALAVIDDGKIHRLIDRTGV